MTSFYVGSSCTSCAKWAMLVGKMSTIFYRKTFVAFRAFCWHDWMECWRSEYLRFQVVIFWNCNHLTSGVNWQSGVLTTRWCHGLLHLHISFGRRNTNNNDRLAVFMLMILMSLLSLLQTLALLQHHCDQWWHVAMHDCFSACLPHCCLVASVQTQPNSRPAWLLCS